MTRNEVRPGQVGSLTLPIFKLMPVKIELQAEVIYNRDDNALRTRSII